MKLTTTGGIVGIADESREAVADGSVISVHADGVQGTRLHTARRHANVLLARTVLRTVGVHHANRREWCHRSN